MTSGLSLATAGINANVWVVALAGAISFGVPLVLAALGEILAERSGVLNLGVEGMMLVGAVSAFLVADATHSPWLAILAAMAAAAALAAVHAFLCVTLRANQIVSGLALVIFGGGLARFVGSSVEGQPRGAEIDPLRIPVLADLPVLGRVIFQQDVLVYATVVVTALVALYIVRTRPGLALRAVGESPATADAAGVSVARVRYLHVILGGALAGAGASYTMLVLVPSWNGSATTDGIGWIALALVVFASWRPWRALAGAVIFGFALRANFTLQAAGITAVPPEVLSMLPYLLTIVVLIALAPTAVRRRAGAPSALGAPYVRDER
ncbi:MAG: ABC transporter permease [Actinomycetes bacterium]